jgi:CubicO group peptidase (beta-lactamase class C family)
LCSAANAASAAPPGASSLFRIGSVSKLLVALMYLQAAQRLPALAGSTLGQLLPTAPAAMQALPLAGITAHVSGLPHDAPCPEGDCNLTTLEVLDRMTGWPLLSPPYTQAAYSNLGYALLGHALVPLLCGANTSFEACVALAVLQPLNLTSTGFLYTSSVLARLANGTANLNNFDDLGWTNPCGGAYMSGADAATLTQLLTQESLGGSQWPARLASWFTPSFFNTDGSTGFGIAWEIAYNPAVAAWQYGKGGAISNWTAQVRLRSRRPLHRWPRLMRVFPPPLPVALRALTSGCGGGMAGWLARRCMCCLPFGVP